MPAREETMVTRIAFAVETAILTYLLVEFGEDNGDELKIPDPVNMSQLISAANEIDVLNAPINVPDASKGLESADSHRGKTRLTPSMRRPVFFFLCLEHVETLGAYRIPPETGAEKLERAICPKLDPGGPTFAVEQKLGSTLIQ